MSGPPILVQKYGGSSVATPERIAAVAAQIKGRVEDGYRLCVVVSAMGDTTDELLAQAARIHEKPPRRELDMLLTCGERASMALLAMALDKLGVPSISFTGSQSGILTTHAHTGARIVEVRPFRIQDELDEGKVVIVAGFQGVSYRREITTLGRGGSDTTAVALAAALDAEACEIYSDVDGVYSADPRVVPEATRLEELTYEEMQELAAAGARVLNAQAVQFAKARGIAIFARQTGSSGTGTVIRKDAPPAPGAVRGVAHKERLYSLHTADLSRARSLLAFLDEHGLPSGEILGRAEGGVHVLVPPDDAHGADAAFARLPDGCLRSADVGAVSLVGAGLLEDRHVVLDGLGALDEAGLACRGLSTSSFRATFLLDPDQTLAATRLLHQRFLARADAVLTDEEAA